MTIKKHTAVAIQKHSRALSSDTLLSIDVESIKLTLEELELLQKHQKLKLQIELVPRSCWWSNVRTNVKKSDWDKIRFDVYKKANFLCEICGGKGTKHPVECHEVWVYDESSLTQCLEYFQAICPLCHEVKHIGYAGIRGNRIRAFNHFKEQNELDETIAKKIRNAVFKQWRIRNQQKWQLNLEYLRQYSIEPLYPKKG